MRFIKITIVWLFLVALVPLCHAQLLKPVITGQDPIETTLNTPVTVNLADIHVALLNSPLYPLGFSLALHDGTDYTYANATVTPKHNFKGDLKVPVTINDGVNESDPYDLLITVRKLVNEKPVITGQSRALGTNPGQPITILLTDLVVTDSDNNYPDDFTLKVGSGPNYSRSNETVTPDPGFTGDLQVEVQVHDGTDESEKFYITVHVNAPPVITGQAAVTTQESVPVTITLADLVASDAENDPLTLTVMGGTGYTFVGNTVTPNAGVTGSITVAVKVDDGKIDSSPFGLIVNLTPKPNQPPSISGQVAALTTVEATPIILKLADLIASDPDNDPLTLIVVPGTGYTVSNTTTVTPNAGIIGNLTVTVKVNDGKVDSAPFGLVIDVTKKPNQAPLITGQVPLSTNVNTPITLQVNNVSITDPDNNPGDFTLIISGGANYIVVNSTVTPNTDFVGKLTIPIKVSDGQAESPSFDLEVDVTPKPNVVPIITSQDALSTFIGTPITLKVDNLRITDPDNTYPGDFTLLLHNGPNYTFSGTTVTPNLLFVGDLTVPVTVRDNASESASFPLKITVTLLPNIAPIIIGQDPLKTLVGTPITIDLNDIKVTDPDNKYPDDFSLLLYNGSNYIFNNATVTPAAGFIGKLLVPVTVNDGKATSNKATLEIVVEEPVNEVPVITGQNDVKVDEDLSLTLTPAMLKITDPDSKDFTLKVFPPPTNAKYTVNGNVITPALNFNGDLSVKVSVSDGKNESAPFDLKVTVTPVNDAPVIIAQAALSTLVETPININVTDVTISDPDLGNVFTIRVNPALTGAPYSVSGNSITPLPGITGEISVSVSVNDGTANSVPYFLRINVTKAPNVPPKIVKQDPNPLVATQNTPKEIFVTDLTIEDPDNKTGFKLFVKPGPNYTVTGTTITPSNNFIGDLRVPVYVNDGAANSPDFVVNVNVSPPNVRPQIIGQKSVTTAEDTPVTITLGDLIVTDADDTYPNGFTLTVFEGTGYAVDGTTVTPAKDLNGFLLITVRVTDNDGKVSDPYAMAILITPVDDAPVISRLEANEISYEPGTDPTPITSTLELQDVDNDHLSFAEISFDSLYQPNYDELLFTDAGNIRGVFDLGRGKLSLIGYATLQEYQEAIRSVRFNFVLTTTEGQPQIDPKNKTISITVHDGQMFSSNVTRKIIMDTDIKLNIPSAFSPNDDRVNETWQVVALSNADQCEKAVVRVYDKRGVLLFHSVGIEKQWDGKYNGELLPVDTYFYTVDLNLSYIQKTYRGSVTLIR